ncbi:glycosyltransferase family 2 protein [Patescibacteria group bacterium]|nr:glycosyltransferase family 2 protein [Patescibacteria group bacterium]
MGRVVYIIIINWNGFSDTKECIESLLKVEGTNYKVVLVDNGSKNFEGRRLKGIFPSIKLISNEKNEGFCKGNNTAIYYCLKKEDCGYIMILNNDVVIEKDFFKPLLKELEKNPKSIVSPMILDYSNPEKVQTMGGKLFLGGVYHIGKNRRRNEFTEVVYPDSVSGACFMSKREAFEEVGLFDEQFFAYLEDLDWSVRANKCGYKLFTVPSSVIYHKHSQSTKDSYMKVYLIAKNNILFARKNLSGIKKTIFIINSVIVGFVVNVIKYKKLFFIKEFVRGIRKGIE